LLHHVFLPQLNVKMAVACSGVQMSLPGHDAALGEHPRSEFSWNLTTDVKKVKSLGERLKKGRQKFCERNTNYFRGHPRTSLAPGHPTASARHWKMVA